MLARHGDLTYNYNYNCVRTVLQFLQCFINLILSGWKRAPNNHIFNTEDCPMLRSTIDVNIQQCFHQCLLESNCTAINADWREQEGDNWTANCTLLDCPFPVNYPKKIVADSAGHFTRADYRALEPGLSLPMMNLR